VSGIIIYRNPTGANLLKGRDGRWVSRSNQGVFKNEGEMVISIMVEDTQKDKRGEKDGSK